MYVTMMMTDHIPLDLAPPSLLNGEVPLMPHMVNGDAAQQVRKVKGRNSHTHMWIKNKENTASVPLSTFLSLPTHMHAHAHTPDACKNTHQTAVQPLPPLLSFQHVANSCRRR